MAAPANKFRFDTLLIHGGNESNPSGATTLPIVQSSAFAHETAEQLEDLFRGRKIGHVYTRLGNPTIETFERRLALLEGGIAAIATASGMAAITTAVMSVVRSGDEILSSSSVFSGTYSLFRDTLSNFGIGVRFVDPTDLNAVAQAITPKTKLIFTETIGNPKLDVPDIAALAAIAKGAGVPFMVDATVTTPYLVRVKELGADIVIHSTSKFINGTANAIGGAIIDCGTFDWSRDGFPHFAPFHKKYRQFAFTARVRKLIHKDFGACAAPMNSFLTAEGIETLALRMERHCSNALALARFLQEHPRISWVNYPGLPSSGQYQIATSQYRGYGGILTFGIGDKESSFRLINSLRLVKNMTNIGDAKTMIIHPASTFCCDFTAAEQELMGVTANLLRVSVGIEAIDDIIEDFTQALDNI